MNRIHMKRQSYSRWMLVGAAVAVILTMTGCNMTKDPYQPTDPGEAARAAKSLDDLPSLEDTEAELASVIEQLGHDAATIAPTLRWQWHDEPGPSRGGCNPPYEQSDGEEILMRKYVSDTPIPDENWNQVLAIARDAAAKLGTTGMEVFQDAPGKHDVRFYNKTGTALRIGSQIAALITGSTGCRLSRDKK
jgi:hypothetical protein